MSEIKIFFGSDTGNTENIANIIRDKLGSNIANIFDIAKSNKKDIEQCNKIIFGIPTWYYGEPQCDWDQFFPTMQEINFENKKVAIFGCGDQEDYAEYFCDAIGLLYNILNLKNAKLVGKWPCRGYYFKSSKAISNNKDYFYGLAIDEDRQKNLTKARIDKWINQITHEMDIY